MKIAYICPSINPIKGGIERVTYILKEYFQTKRHEVFCIAVKQKNNQDEKDLIFLPELSADNTEVNKLFLSKFVENYKIDIVIAQIGAPGKGSDLVASLPNKVKKIACIHLDLLDSVRHFGAYKSVELKKKGLGFLVPYLENNFMTDVLVRIKKAKYHKGYNELYDRFDRIVLLSDMFKDDFAYLLGRSGLSKLVGISNPLPLMEDISHSNLYKGKTVLYVGRINTGQKKVDYLLKIWSVVSKQHPDWQLKIVGDGPDLPAMKIMAQQMELDHYSFEGYSSPENYYKESPILCLTSSYEGFGMVLIEAMRYGVVPIAFDSYASVGDIIENHKSGLLVKPFDIKAYADAVGRLIDNEQIWKNMSTECICKAETFKADVIGDRWLSLFNQLMTSHES